MKTIVFRVDSGNHIGIGHMMRCLTLAKDLLRNGCNIHFISKNHKGSLIHILKQEFPTHELDVAVSENLSEDHKNNYSYWLGEPEKEDLQKTNRILASIGNVDLVIVDHYSLSKLFETGLRGRKVMVIDDLCFREHKCDLLLNQNLGTSRADYAQAQIDKYLLGPRFSLLRPEFRVHHLELESILADEDEDGEVKSFLVFFGFGDIAGHCLRLAQALRDTELKNYNLTFLLNEGHRDFTPLMEWKKKVNKEDIRVISHTDDMATLMMRHDFFIGAGGATSWERACLGMPSAVVELAENQSKICQALSFAGWAYDLGRSEDLSKTKWHDFFNDLIKNKEKIKDMSRLAYLGVDGLGAERVSKAILDLVNEE